MSAGPASRSVPATCRVLFVDYSVGFGGATKSLALTLRAMPEVEKFVLTCQDSHIIRRWYPDLQVFAFRRLMNYRTMTHVEEWLSRRPAWMRWPVRKGLVTADAAASLANGARIVALGRRLRVDVVHLNNGYVPLEALLAAHLLRVPCVVHLRGFVGIGGGLERRAASRVAEVIAVSDAVAGIVDPAVIPAGRVTRIYDPVDVDAFDRAAGERHRVRQQWGIGPDEVLVGIFGRVTRWKGQLEFVRAVAEAMRTHPQIRGAIVGDCSDDTQTYFDDVRRAITGAGIEDRFRMMGYHEDVEPYYHAMDIVVHASIEPEPFGMVVPEGMAAGKPVVAVNEGGPSEVVAPGVDGLLVRAADIGAMAAAIGQLTANPELRSRMGARGYQKVREGFSIGVAAAQLAGIYAQVRRRREP